MRAKRVVTYILQGFKNTFSSVVTYHVVSLREPRNATTTSLHRANVAPAGDRCNKPLARYSESSWGVIESRDGDEMTAAAAAAETGRLCVMQHPAAAVTGHWLNSSV